MVAGTLLVLAATVGACGDDAGTDNGSTTASGAGDKPKPAATVVLDNLAFKPAKVTIKAGETVLWRWEDSVQHDVVGDGFKSQIQTNGRYTHTFDEAGTYDYSCTVHPTMKGTVEVT